MDVSQQYAAGLWVPSYYGLKYRVARKGTQFALPNGGMSTEIDPSQTFGTLAAAAAEADARNARGAQ